MCSLKHAAVSANHPLTIEPAVQNAWPFGTVCQRQLPQLTYCPRCLTLWHHLLQKIAATHLLSKMPGLLGSLAVDICCCSPAVQGAWPFDTVCCRQLPQLTSCPRCLAFWNRLLWTNAATHLLSKMLGLLTLFAIDNCRNSPAVQDAWPFDIVCCRQLPQLPKARSRKWSPKLTARNDL